MRLKFGAVVTAFCSTLLTFAHTDRTPNHSKKNDSNNSPFPVGHQEAFVSLSEDGLYVCPLPVDVLPLLHRCSATQLVAESLDPVKYRSRFKQSTAGRWHCLSRDMDAASAARFSALEETWLPSVQTFFAGQSEQPEKMKDGRTWYRSELQLLNASPGAETQFFHQDNRCLLYALIN